MRGRAKSNDSKTRGEILHILKILRKWGINTLGQLACLDREDLNARLGPEAVRLWRRANGTSTRLLKLIQPPESFAENFEFEQEVETVEPLLFMLRRFLQKLALRLNAIYLVTKEVTLRITFADKKSYEHKFTIPQPTNDVDLLFRMLHTHLENFKSPQPIIAVSLEAEPGKSAQQQFTLFETALRDPHQLYETLSRLTAFLGKNRVGTPVLEETHRPDAFRIEPFSWQLSDQPGPTAPPKPGPVLRRFRPNIAASVFLDETKPAYIQGRKVEGEILAQEGPYTLSGDWWDESRWSRREWDVQLTNGMVAQCHQGENGWALDGIYD